MMGLACRVGRLLQPTPTLQASDVHVDATVCIPNHDEWKLTCVYGEAQVGERYKNLGLTEVIGFCHGYVSATSMRCYIHMNMLEQVREETRKSRA